ncbi:MAG: Trm112 family protein [Thermoplasmata archaeon]|nr:MAG: Trm112 family protein [Thermoplasmata archaeon]
MKEKFVQLMCCPACRGELELQVKEKEGDDILEGMLICRECKAEYEIRDGIPYMINESGPAEI